MTPSTISSEGQSIIPAAVRAEMGVEAGTRVAYLAQDDARQSAQSNKVMESLIARSPGFISILTLAALSSEGLNAQRTAPVWRSLRDFASGRAGLADHLIERLGAAADCEWTYSFDKSAVRDAGMRAVARMRS